MITIQKVTSNVQSVPPPVSRQVIGTWFKLFKILYFLIFLYCNHQVHKDFLITLYTHIYVKVTLKSSQVSFLHAIKVYVGATVQLHIFLISTTEEDEWLALRPGYLNRRKAPQYHPRFHGSAAAVLNSSVFWLLSCVFARRWKNSPQYRLTGRLGEFQSWKIRWNHTCCSCCDCTGMS